MPNLACAPASLALRAATPTPGRTLNLQARTASVRQTQRVFGNQAAQRMVQRFGRQPVQGAGGMRSPEGGFAVQRDISVEDLIPDAILNPIKSLAGSATDFITGVTTKSDKAASGAKADADTAAAKVDEGTGAQVSESKTQGEGAASKADAQAHATDAAGNATQATGEAQATQIDNALPAAEYVSDPVKPMVSAPPAGTLPGVGKPVNAAGPGQTWNCDEASILGRVSSVGKNLINGVAKLVKSVVPEEVLQFAQKGIAKLQSAIGGIKQKVEAARKAVTQWVDDKLKPVRELTQKVERLVSEKIDAAKKAISEKAAQLSQWAAAKWTALKTGVTNTVNGVIHWAKSGVSGLLDRAKELAGRFWDSVPDAIKRPLAGAAASLAAPVVLAIKTIDTVATWVDEKSGWVKKKLVAAADGATQWLATKYQKARAVVVEAGEGLSKRVAGVRKKLADVGRSVYDGIDKLSGGRVSKWRAAAAARFAELKGKVCAATGAAAGPCVERFVPEPVGAGGKSFASLATKAEITVPIEGVPVKVAAGAKVTIERSAKTYKAILSGEGFAGVALKLSGGGGSGGGGGGGGGSLTVDGTLPNKALALLSLSGQGPGAPGVPIPIGGGQKAPAGGTPANVPATTPAAEPAAAAPGGGGGGVSASAEMGRKVSVALTYTFDATADKSTCDGLGGLTAFLASQGAAVMLPQPFSNLAAAGGQAAFADKLTSAKITVADTGSVSAQIGQGSAKASGSVKGESGASLEAKVLDDKTKSKALTATLFRSLNVDGAASFAPGGIGLAKIGVGVGGRQEIAMTYNITLDQLDASFKQSLSGSASVGAFAGMLDTLPAAVRDAIRRRLACVPDANEATVSFELSTNIANLRKLAEALDGELNKGENASAAAVWDVISTFLQDKDNCFVEFSAKLTLTEKVLGVKASGSADQASGSAEINVSRGQEIVLCPPTKLLGGGGGGAAAAIGAAGAASVASFPGTDAACDEDALIRRFGNARRDLDLDPDKDPKTVPRPDDVPILETFRGYYNRLDSWNFHIRSKHQELYAEFQSTFDIEQRRNNWTKELKDRAALYKEEFRDLQNTDPAAARQKYEAYVLGNIQKEIDDCNRAIATWYRDKTGSTESIDEIIEAVHGEGTEVWRAAWRAAILQVNRVLNELWPPAKGKIVQWVGEQRARLPHVDLSGGVGELDYIGSLATGYKGPPKQQVRFNPDKFDVDANLAAPPLAKYAIAAEGATPDKKRIFGRNTKIAPLNQFSDQAHAELSARAKGYDQSDKFDVAIDSAELPVQERGRLATERLYKLRTTLDTATYQRLIGELQAGGYLTANGKAAREDLTETQFNEMNAIMDRYGGGE